MSAYFIPDTSLYTVTKNKQDPCPNLVWESDINQKATEITVKVKLADGTQKIHMILEKHITEDLM